MVNITNVARSESNSNNWPSYNRALVGVRLRCKPDLYLDVSATRPRQQSIRGFDNHELRLTPPSRVVLTVAPTPISTHLDHRLR